MAKINKKRSGLAHLEVFNETILYFAASISQPHITASCLDSEKLFYCFNKHLRSCLAASNHLSFIKGGVK